MSTVFMYYEDNWPGRAKRSAFLLGACLLVFVSPLLSADQGARSLGEQGTEELLQAVSQSLETVHTIQADFVQERTLSLFLDTLVTEGRIFFLEPDSLRWEVLDPYRSIMLYVDGKIAKFDMVDGKPAPVNMGSTDVMEVVMQEIAYWMKGDFSRSRAMYNLDARVDEEGYYLYLLPSKPDQAGATGPMIIGLDPETYHVVSVRIDDPAGNGMSIRFLNEQINGDLSPGLFDSRNPAVQ